MNNLSPHAGLNAQFKRRDILHFAAIGGALAASGGLLSACGGTSAAVGSGSPRRGGHLRVALTAGAPSGTIDAHRAVLFPDILRVLALYNGLVRLSPDAKSIIMDLAESITSNKKGTVWTVRLKKGVQFHNGKPLTAADVIYSYRRISDPKDPKNGFSSISDLDRDNMKAIDAHTIEMPMKRPFGTFLEQISAVYDFGIVPEGYNPKKPVGTGPFKFVNYTPGRQSQFDRNENYFVNGRPYLDQLTILDSFDSDTAAYNALQGGQVDVYGNATLTLASSAASAGLKAQKSLPGQWTPFTMRVDQGPFKDNRVRQAFRLVIDRKQMIEQALSGFGEVGNDIFSQWDVNYRSDLVREQDLGQAKFLLKQAGMENLSVTLSTGDISVGVLQMAQVFVEQAKGAGVKVNISKMPVNTFYGPNYLKWTFAQDFWGYSPYFNQIARGMLSDSPYNETHWNDAEYLKLYAQANATTKTGLQREISHELQKIDFDRGSLIIPAYNRQVDLMSTKVHGFQPTGTGQPLGHSWAEAWLDA